MLQKIACPVVALGLTACPSGRIDFETDTVVSEDGAVARTTRYAVSGAGKDELDERYQRLDGGAWDVREAVEYDATTGEATTKEIHLYSVTRSYSPGEEIPSDHIRRGRTEGRVVRNRIELSREDYFLVTFFDYRETHGDPASAERLVAVVEDRYPVWTSVLAVQLSQRLDGVSEEAARQVVEEICDPWVVRLKEPEFVREFLAQSDEDDVDAAFVSKLMAKLPPPFVDATDDWSAAMGEAIEETSRSVFDEDEEIEEALFGVYGFCLFSCPSYGFTQTLTLPGVLESTNAASVSGNVLTWEFDEEALWLQDHVLEARSRVVYPGRIVGAAVLLALVLGVAWRRRAGYCT
jgi:hypothetical protein